MTEQQATAEGTSTARAAVSFGFAAAVTLIAGVVLERSGDAIADHFGLSGVLFGATVSAAATSPPELSTGLRSVRHGDYQLAVSDIFGGNAFLPVLFVPATLLSGHAVLPAAERTDIYLTALGIVLTLIYAVGLLFRPPPHRPAGGRLAGRSHPVRPGHDRTSPSRTCGDRDKTSSLGPIVESALPWSPQPGSGRRRPLTRVKSAAG